jgi:hypothetical protein
MDNKKKVPSINLIFFFIYVSFAIKMLLNLLVLLSFIMSKILIVLIISHFLPTKIVNHFDVNCMKKMNQGPLLLA